MTDRAYENATARREDLAKAINDAQQRLEILRGELRSVDTFIDLWHQFAGIPSTTASASGSMNGSPSASAALSGRALRNSKKEEVAAVALELIRKAGEPIPRSNLLTLLINKGLIIGGADPEVVLSTMLWRTRDKIVRLKRGGYWDAEQPSPDGSYRPGEANDAEHLASMTRDEQQAAIAGPEPD